jgi:hypothetical protein
MKNPSKERGCDGKTRLGRSYINYVNKLKRSHGRDYGVYRCPHCQGHHLTTRLENSDQYEPLIYRTDKP